MARVIFSFTRGSSNSQSILRILRRYGKSREVFPPVGRSVASAESYVWKENGVRGCPISLKRFDVSRRYYSVRGHAGSKKPLYPLPEEPPTNTVPWRFFLIPASVLAGISAVLTFLHYNDENRAIPKGKGEKFERSIIKGPIIGGPFELIDTDGQVTTEKTFLGNWVLLYFGCTSSPDVGPAEVQKMVTAIRTLESERKLKVLLVFVTVDPQRDNPSQLHAYLSEFDSRIVGLTGPAASIRQMAREYRVFFKKVDEEGGDYLVDSSHNMYLLNPNMEVTRFFGTEYSASELVEEIAKELMKTRTNISQN